MTLLIVSSIYTTGTSTACGTLLNLTGKLAALSSDVFLSGENCARRAFVTYNDIEIEVTVVDLCTICPAESLQITPVS